MKSLFTIFICVIIILCSKNSFSVPLSGPYTVGSGGQYPTINAAIGAAFSNGIIGPVFFRILPGTYNESNDIPFFPGSSRTNKVIFESSTGNPDDVIINGSPYVFKLDNTGYIIIRHLRPGNIRLTGPCFHIEISDNKFHGAIEQTDLQSDSLLIKNNTGLSSILLTSNNYIYRHLVISNNTFTSPHSFLLLSANSENTIIEKNHVNALNVDSAKNFRIDRNKVEGYDAFFYVLGFRQCANGEITNNFIVSYRNTYEVIFHRNADLKVLNNSFTSETHEDTTASINENFNCQFMNNIFYSHSGGYLTALRNNTGHISDYNNYYNGNGGHDILFFNGFSFGNLQSYRTVTGLDIHSTVRGVSFLSQNDLHLAGLSVGDTSIRCLPHPDVTEDIDGQPRNPLYPYMGADEADIPLPVEIVSFTCNVHNNNVLLNWTTLSEENNYGFEIERSGFHNVPSFEWIKVGFVNGSGNQSSIHNYSFQDKGLNTGKYNYRLKQIDFNGNYKYYFLSNDVEVGVPAEYSLSQNYPNPFNPSTRIHYDLPYDGNVSIILYDISGREAATLVNEFKQAGYYSIQFNSRDGKGSNLSSGMYFYRMSVNSIVLTKKMVLVK